MAEKRKKDNTAPDPALLLDWYDAFGRDLPWRSKKGESPDPYRVWLSEIMLQQTTVATVTPYFAKFLARWPKLEHLAEATLDDVLRAWAGLGYYRRARNLHACAGIVARDYGGVFPRREDELRALPGIGPYTAAAIASIAFDQKANVVDGNVERVVARVYAVSDPMPAAKNKVRALAENLLPERRFGDYAQALMDLGATVCAPRGPLCALCPWKDRCLAFARGQAELFPVRAEKRQKQLRRGTAFVLRDGKGRVLLRKRGDRGLLAGMTEVPSGEWAKGKGFSFEEAPAAANWKWIKGRVRHVFTHFDLELRVAVASVPSSGNIRGRWVPVAALRDEALPSVMRKILFHAGLKE